MELAIFLEETLSAESKQVSFKVPQHNAAGQRVADITKTLNVKIPAGVVDGEDFVCSGWFGNVSYSFLMPQHLCGY